MKKNGNTINARKRMSMMVMGSLALLAAVFAVPVSQAVAHGGMGSKAASADASLVCMNRASVLAALGLDADSDPTHAKTTICHFPPGNEMEDHTITVADPAIIHAHESHGDTMGLCEGWVTRPQVEAMPGCTSLEEASSEPGVWVPESMVANGHQLNAYVAKVNAGVLPGFPDATSRSYREISGQ